MRKKIVVSLSLLMILPLFSGAQKSPDEFFNTTIGADRTLIAYPQIRKYFNHLASASARVRISDEGVSTLGNPLLLAVISSEKNVRKLAELIEINKKLANPDRIDPQMLPGLIACRFSGQATTWASLVGPDGPAGPEERSACSATT